MQFTTTLLIAANNHHEEALALVPFKNPHNNPDVTVIISQEKSIGIKLIKDIIPKLWSKPYKEAHKVIIIPDAQTMTIEAQNAFLKSIEEPPENTQIILVSTSKTAFLATILSRCIVKYSSKKEKEGEKESVYPTMIDILAMQFGKRMSLTESHTTKRETAKEWCTQLLYEVQKHIEKHPSDGKYIDYAETISICLTRLSKNVNPKLAVGTLMLSLET